MDIYITGKNAKGANQKIQLPVIPEEIETSLDGKFAEYDIYRFGQINVPNGKNLSGNAGGESSAEGRRYIEDLRTLSVS